jgi:tetratricopeptide (TPR) repeat protein
VGLKNSTTALFEAAVASHNIGKPLEALASYRKLARANPRNVVALLHLGVLLHQLGKLEEAEKVLRRALVLAPESAPTRQALSLVLMAQGQYAEGWPLYESRHEIPAMALPNASAFPFPRWRGQPLQGKRIVVFPEQGLGDQIQFARFVPSLLAAGAEVTLLVPEALLALFRHSFPEANVLAAVGSVEFPDPDYWAMSAGLVNDLGVTLETLPSKPYLHTPARRRPFAAGFQIGVQLRGNPNHRNDVNRSLSPQAAAWLRTGLPGRVVGLDPSESNAADFAETAAIIQQLDLVIAVDTSVAHLAGAMGKPALVLLPAFDTDWRWLRNREDSPWYPSLKLYRRGPLDDDWVPTLERVTQDAHVLARAKELSER